MNWAQFKDPITHRCLAGAVVAFWSLTQILGLIPFNGKTPMPHAEFVLIGERQNTDWLAPNTLCSLTNANYDIVHSLAFLELYLTPVGNFEHSLLYSSSSLKL